ncbi:MAG: PAS domain S-box protein [Kiritimatiellae bacterium]|nr:PAS domain S-box protein [Kiritimatiellia bacterium]
MNPDPSEAPQARTEADWKDFAGAAISSAAVLDQMKLAVLITDFNGRIAYVNKAFEQTTGYTAAEAVGQNANLLNSGQQWGIVFREMNTVLREGKAWEGMLINRRKNGQIYRADSSIFPVRDAAGAIRWLVSVSRDVSRDLETEEKIRHFQRMDSLNHLASGVAHDFNNTLTPILAYAELALIEFPEPRTLRSYLEEIHRCAERGAVIARRIMSFGARRVPDLAPVELNELIGIVQRIIQPALRENIRIDFKMDPNAGSISADASLVEQAVINLALNAQDSMPEGGSIVVSVGRNDSPKDTADGKSVAWIEVSDTGGSIPAAGPEPSPEALANRPSVTGAAELGLASVQTIMRQHHGLLTWKSNSNGGVAVRMNFPPLHAAQYGKPSSARMPLIRGKETILLVEDDDGVRGIASELLRRTGYTVHDFGDAAQSLRFARHFDQKLDLLLLDVTLPDQNGKELQRNLLDLHPGVRTLFLTGNSPLMIKNLGLENEEEPVLRKPFTIYDLSMRVREVLDQPAQKS